MSSIKISPSARDRGGCRGARRNSMQTVAQFLVVVGHAWALPRIKYARPSRAAFKMEIKIRAPRLKLTRRSTDREDPMLRRHSRFRCLVLFVALGLSDLALGAPPATEVLPLVSGDEPIVVSTHQIKTAEGTVNYEARAGRLPIRNDEKWRGQGLPDR